MLTLEPQDLKVIPLENLGEPAGELSMASHHPGQPGQEPLKGFVQLIFQRAYGARIHTFYPHLIEIRRDDGSFAAVAGVRPAGVGPLYAEQYLDEPLEVMLSRSSAQPVSRRQVVEIGNLAPAGSGQARWLIAALTAYVHAAGFTHVIFTAVPALHNAFHRMGLPLTRLAPADPARLDAGGKDDWGSYYHSGPQVCAGRIARGHSVLDDFISARRPRLRRLWRQAEQLGRADRERLCGPADVRKSA